MAEYITHPRELIGKTIASAQMDERELWLTFTDGTRGQVGLAGQTPGDTRFALFTGSVDPVYVATGEGR